MSLLFSVVFTNCRSTHHKMAMDSLRFLRGPDADEWNDLFLKFYKAYLEGAKAPDDQFKDFKNHVLHVRDNFWGGAVGAAQKWYARTVELLRSSSWEEAVYAAGVLSHYYTDPHMPLHTGQSEAEGPIHRAAEWSITKSYHELQNIIDLDLGGYPKLEAPTGPDWLGEIIRQGAQKANPHYEVIIDHYNLALGLKDPPLGLDQEIKDRIAQCLGVAIVGFARVLERAFEDAGSRPPMVDVSVQGVLAAMSVPLKWVTNQIVDGAEREQIKAIYAELQATGKVIVNLPEDDAAIRKIHGAEVLNKTVAELNAEPARQPGRAHGQGAKPRYHWNVPITHTVQANKPRGNARELLRQPLASLPPLERATYSNSRRRRPVDEDDRVEEEALAEPVAHKTIAEPVAQERIAPLPVTQTPTTSLRIANPPTAPQRPQPHEEDTLAELEAAVGGEDDEYLDEDADDLEGDEIDAAAASTNKPSVLSRIFQPFWGKKKSVTPASEVGEEDTTEEQPKVRPAAANESRPDQRRAKTERSDLVSPAAPAPSPRLSPTASPAQAATKVSERIEALRTPEKSPSPTPADSPPLSLRLRFHLDRDHDVIDAPSIGKKTADRLKSVGINTVEQLISANPDQLHKRLKQSHITPEVIEAWQHQATLACRIPEVRGHDAQILVGSGITDPEEVAGCSPEDLLELIAPYVEGEEGQRILRGSPPPDLIEVTNWIKWAGQARDLKAA